MIYFVHMNTHCYTAVTADPCLVIVTQDITSQVHIFLTKQKGKFLSLGFLLLIHQRGMLRTLETRPGNSVVTQVNFPTRPPVLLMLNFKVLAINL